MIPCKNCQQTLDPTSNYCHDCGGKVIRKRLTIRNLFEHISETFLNYDNKLFRTLRDLVIRPQVVIDDYVSGVRMRYVNPISLFALVLTISGISLFIMKRFYADALSISSLFADSGFYSEDMLAMLDESTGTSMEYNSFIYSIMVPVFAIMSAIIFYDKRYNLTEHVIIYLYSMSILSLFSVIITQIVLLINPTYFFVFSFFFLPVMFFYHAYLLKKLFDLNRWELILRSIIFLFFLGFLYIAIVLISLAVGLASGSMNLDQFKPKNA